MFRCGGNISNKIDNVSEYPKTEKLRIEITSFTVVILIQPVFDLFSKTEKVHLTPG